MSGVRVALVLVIMLLFVKSTEAVDERIRAPDIEASLFLLLLLYFAFSLDWSALMVTSSLLAQFPRVCLSQDLFGGFLFTSQ